MNTTSDTLQQYEEHKALQSTFEFINPQKWDKEGIKRQAFLDKETPLYTTSLAPFEYLLKKQFSSDEQDAYEELVTLYRREYFFHQNRTVSYGFILGGKDELDVLAKNCALKRDKETLLEYIYTWQKKVDALLKEEDVANLPVIRRKEFEVLQEFEVEFTQLCSKVNNYAKELELLLSEYSRFSINAKEYVLNSQFQNTFDLTHPDDLIEYLKSKTEHNVKSDILHIREIFQRQIIQNNRDAELKSKTTTDLGETLLMYAALEQDIVSDYRAQLGKYYYYLQTEPDFEQLYKPFELYFDNYFADFDNTLRYYSLVYKDEDVIATQTPYYTKMFNSTEAKISVVQINATTKIEEAKEAYVKNRNALSALKLAKLEYKQEIVMLLDEFRRYGELYISKINNNAKELQEHAKNVELLKERFNLKEENGFF